jgi:four helix bundle protein
MIKSFRDLEVWQRAHVLVLEIYRLTNAYPRTEQFGVVSQLRRAAYSIPANIAEGFGRRSTKELLQCLAIANGSLEEVRYFLLLSRDLRYLPTNEFSKMERELKAVAEMMSALARSLKNRLNSPTARVSSSRGTEHGSRITNQSAGAAS